MRFSASLAALVSATIIGAACTPAASPTAAPTKLDTKLEATWKRWEAARQTLVRRVVDEKKEIGRDEWEKLLAPGGDATIDDADLTALRDRHRTLAEAAKAEARGRSKIDLDALRAKGDAAITAFCHDMPKGGMLHVHALGTIQRSTMDELLAKLDPEVRAGKIADAFGKKDASARLYDDELARLRALAARKPPPLRFHDLSGDDRAKYVDLFVLPPGRHSFERFDGVFEVWGVVFPEHRKALWPAAWPPFVERARARRVRYVELMKTVPDDAALDELEAWADELETRTGMIARVRAGLFRFDPPETSRANVEKLLALRPSRVLVGLDMMGNETRFPALESGQTIYATAYAATARGKTTLRRSMHAGELGDVRNVRDALVMGVERIGHGVRLRDDPVALEYARRSKIPIEANLVSNDRLGAVQKLEDHPFLLYLRLGLPVSLSTDDEGLFGTTIDDECALAVKSTDIQYDELRRMALYAIESS